MRDIKALSNLPWIVIGDFNQILFEHEKKGGVPREQKLMDDFREVINDCELLDVGFSGAAYTWWNRRSGPEAVYERLDRALVSPAFLEVCPSIVLNHLEFDKSDHVPIELAMFTPIKSKKGKRFRFEDMWTTSEGCEEVVRDAWANASGSTHGQVALHKLSICTKNLGEWSKVQFGDLRRQIEETRRRMHFLDTCANDDEAVTERRASCLKLDELLMAEEIFWRQRSRVSFLTEGDQNTRFFHLRASNRKRRNRINRLKDAGGNWVVDEGQMRVMAMNFFDNLFSSAGPSRVDEAVACLEPCVTEEMNAELTKPFTREEVRVALFQMKPSKAPGPDGLNANFYQKYWHIIGNDVADYVINCLEGREDITTINHTHIVLIPKVKHATDLNNFRPISLCNVIYKLVSKVLVGRLKGFLDDLVEVEQSAFIPGRLIADNAILAFESFHFIKSHNSGQRGYMSLKLDMSKAYDRVEWSFLERVLVRMGFAPRWVDVTMNCVRTVKSAILINGAPSDFIRPRRGLRQGDPYSPYLFILCANVFSRLLSKEVERRNLYGVRICRAAPCISHLFFADDSLILCRADKKNAETIKGVLDLYQEASGQRLNLQKSELFFSPSVGDSAKDEVLAILEATAVLVPGKYLGIPAIVGRNKMMAFNPLKERIWKNLKGWKEKLLSYSGREILIKAVAQSIPTYLMGLFKFPTSLCSKIEGDLARFWWGHSGEKRQIFWISWEKMCRSKKDGGLGYRHFESFNLAMLTKQLWRLYERPNSLVARVLSARYYPSGSLFDAVLGHHPSFVWRSLMDALPVFTKGCKWVIGNGQRARFWRDKWCSSRLISPVTGMHDSVVADWFEGQPRRWNEDLLRQHLYEFEAREVMRIPLVSTEDDDILAWAHTKNGVYTVKSGYHFICEEKRLKQGERCSSSSRPRFWSQLWSLKLPPKIKNFVWRACKGALPCGLNVQKRVNTADPTCQRCFGMIETDTHALLDCPYAHNLWELGGMEDGFVSGVGGGSLVDWVEGVMRHYGEDEVNKSLVLLWASWNYRNEDYHGTVRADPGVAVEKALSFWEAWQHAQLGRGSICRGQVRERVVWRPPVMGQWKLNVDAAVMGDVGCGLGAVVRDHNGSVRRMGVKQVREQWEPDVAEAMAAVFGLQMVQQLGVDNVVLEADCSVLITMLKSKSFPSNYFGRVGKYAAEIANHIRCVNFIFTRRDGNVVAHELAHLLPLEFSTRYWDDSVPDRVQPFVDLDVLELPS